MTELVADCPRCKANHVTFDVTADFPIAEQYRAEWVVTYECFSICRRCKRSTCFVLKLHDYEQRKEVSGTPSKFKNSVTLDRFFHVNGYVSVADMGADPPPDHLPAELNSVYLEGSRCLAVGCPNAAGTMFRMCLDISTRAFLPPEGEAGGPNSKQRRDLGLRLPWLFDNGKLPNDLRDLAACIREDGNDGAHAGTLSRHDAEDMRDFTFRLLDRLYSEPERIRLAAARRAARRAPPPP